MSCCGGTSGDPVMRLVRGETYLRAVTWTRKVDDVVVPIVAADYQAVLVLRRSFDQPALLTLTSNPAAGLTLAQDSDSVRVLIDIPADDTEALPLGKGFKYTLAMQLVADPVEDVKILLNSTANVSDSALA